MNSLDISVIEEGTGPVLVLAGEADLTTLAQLKNALDTQLQADAQRLRIDLSRLRFADSATVAALVTAARTLRNRGRQLVLLHPQPSVARVLKLTGADRALGWRGEPAARPQLAPEPAPDKGGSAQPRLRVLLGSADGDVVLRLAGEIDFTTTSIMGTAVDQCLREMPAQMTVDLHAVTFCDCAGGRVLWHAQQQASAAGIRFRLCGLTPPLRRVLTLMQATGLLRAADLLRAAGAGAGAGAGADG